MPQNARNGFGCMLTFIIVTNNILYASDND